MSTLGEIFDRLTGISHIKENQKELENRSEKFLDRLIDHERRLVRLETASELKRLPAQQK
jgi:hypothetical protein